MNSKQITVTVEIPVEYKSIMSGDNAIILEASLEKTYYPITVLPVEARTIILERIMDQTRIDDRESRDALEDFDMMTQRPGDVQS
jgi:hypothetical protein